MMFIEILVLALWWASHCSAVLYPRYITNTTAPAAATTTALQSKKHYGPPPIIPSSLAAQFSSAPIGNGSIFGIPGYRSCEATSIASYIIAPPPQASTATICDPDCVTTVTTVYGEPPPAPSVPSGCCYGCSIAADSVRLMYWEPDLAPPSNATITEAPSAPYTLVSDGFTFTSPSVYVVYYNLHAVADCNPSSITLGVATTATIGYPPDSIFTERLQNCGRGVLQPINYTQLYLPQANSLLVTATECNAIPVNLTASDIQGDPIFQIPQNIDQFEPEWSPCIELGNISPLYCVYDPPFVLTKANGYDDPVTTVPPAPPSSPPNPTPLPTSGSIEVALSSQAAMQPNTVSVQSIDPPPHTLDPQTSDSPVIAPLASPSPTDPVITSSAVDPQPQSVGPPPADPGTTSQAADPGVPTIEDPVDPGSISSTIYIPPTQPTQPPPPALPPVTVNNNPVTAAPGGGVIISGSTFTPGAQATVGGVTVEVSSGFVVAAGSTINFPIPPAPTPIPPTIAGKPVTTVLGGGIVVEGNTLTAGGAPVTIEGTVISALASGNGIIVNGNTVTVPPVLTVTPAPAITLAGQPAQTLPNGGVVIDGQTITPGGAPITVSGAVVSVLPGDGGVVVGGSSTILLPSTTFPDIAGQPIQTAPGGGIIVGGQTITAGGSAATISGTVITVLPSGGGLIVGGSTILLPGATETIAGQPVLTASGGGIIIGGQTISAGGPPATISGEIISVLPNGGGVVVGSSSTLFLNPVPTAVEIGSITIVEGASAVTVDGVAVSLGPSGLEVGSSLVPVTDYGTGNVGGLIYSAFGGGFPNATPTITTFQGSGLRAKGETWLRVQIVALFTGLWLLTIL